MSSLLFSRFLITRGYPFLELLFFSFLSFLFLVESFDFLFSFNVKAVEVNGCNLVENAQCDVWDGSGAYAPGVYIKGGSFVASSIWGINLQQSDMRETNFTDAYFYYFPYQGYNNSCNRGDEANLKEVDASDSVFKNADLRCAKLSDSDFENADFENAILSGQANGSTYGRATIYGSDFSNTNFRNAKLYGLSFSRVNFNGADLRGAQVIAGQFSTSSFVGADLRGANLSLSSFGSSDFTDAKYSESTNMGSKDPVSSGMIFVSDNIEENDTPSAISGDVSVIIVQGNVATGNLSATDSDGLTNSTPFSISTTPSMGIAGIDPSAGTWTYFPTDGSFQGQISFTITVTDDLGQITDQVISILITDPSDVDGDGVNNDVDAFPNDPNESSDIDGDSVGDNADNCVSIINSDQSDIDSDGLGDACDDNIDGDQFDNETENRFGGNNFDGSDADLVISNIQAFSASAPTDSDSDGVSDWIELMVGTDPNDASDAQEALSRGQNLMTAEEVQIPAMGGIGLLALGLSMLGLGAVRLRK